MTQKEAHCNQTTIVDRMTRKLVLANHKLLSISDILQSELECALRGSTANTLKVYPTFVFEIPNGSERGKYLALDLGGTNFRILLIHLEGNHQSSLVNQTFALSKELMEGNGQDLFDYIALCLHNFVVSHSIQHERLSLGFTFSFPCKQVGLKRAYLTSWTKGFCCEDTVNQDVCEMLQLSINKFTDLNVEISAIVNDTTGTLASCAYINPNCRIGVIIGTGVNACYVESDQALLNGLQMIVNTELGAFGSQSGCLESVRTSWDRQLDRGSINKGQQLFEKMISGMYIGEIVRLIVLDLINKGILSFNSGYFVHEKSFSTSLISEVESDPIDCSQFTNTRNVFAKMSIDDVTLQDCQSLHLICRRVSQRSAHLISAAIYAILRRVNEHNSVIGVDGSVYRYHPHYKTLMDIKIFELSQLANEPIGFELMLSEDGSGRGAALVAAVASSQEKNSKRPVCSVCRQFYCSYFPSNMCYPRCQVSS